MRGTLHPRLSEDKLKRGLRPPALDRLLMSGCIQGMGQSMGSRYQLQANCGAGCFSPLSSLVGPFIKVRSLPSCAKGAPNLPALSSTDAFCLFGDAFSRGS